MLLYMHAMRREHMPKSNSLGSLPLQALEADMNLASLGGPIVRLSPRAGVTISDDTATERREKSWRKGRVIVA